MEVIDYNKLDYKGKIIGFGTSAKCFLYDQDTVLKLFYKDYSEKLNLNDKSTYELFDLLCEMHIDSFISPEKLIVSGDKIVGYFYPFIKGKTLKHLINQFTLKNLIERYDKIVEDNKRLAAYKFRLFDLHGNNIIVNDQFNIIDMDRGFIDTYFYDKLEKTNLKYINESIIDTLFKVKYIDDNVFTLNEMSKLYSDLSTPDNMMHLLEKLSKESSEGDFVKFKTLRKTLNKQKTPNRISK